MITVPIDLQHPPPGRLAHWLQALGDGMQRHRRIIVRIQWTVVVFYAALVAVPAFLPLPPEGAHVYNNLTLLAQFLFWGIWWPFVILSMIFIGRVWCGVFCPEGALTEFAGRRGLGLRIPRWMRWAGWPFVAFATTTIYGQLISVYDYPKATLLILGGSTLAAVTVGYVYGGGKRVWCRYLCPANGVFRLLARLAPVHFLTDAKAWRAAPAHTPAVDCAPLVDIRHLSSMANCHACGRCSGHRDAVRLTARSPNREITAIGNAEASPWEVLLLVYGILGIALGAFQWSASPWFVALKQYIATWLIERGDMALLGSGAPWWLLTHYPTANDVLTWLDGLLILFYIAAAAIAVGSWILLWLGAAAALLQARASRWRLAYCLIPMAAVTVFMGLSALTITMLRAEGLPLAWVPWVRAALLVLGSLWSAWLTWRAVCAAGGDRWRRISACGAAIVGIAAVPAALILQFFVW